MKTQSIWRRACNPFILLILFIPFSLTACGAPETEIEHTPTPTSGPTATAPAITSTPGAPRREITTTLSFVSPLQMSGPTTTYTDAEPGIAFDFPAGWKVDGHQGAEGHLISQNETGTRQSLLDFAVVTEGDLDTALDEVKRGAWGSYIRDVQPVRLGEFDSLRLEFDPGEDRPPVVWLVVTPSGRAVAFIPRSDLAQAVLATLRAMPPDSLAPGTDAVIDCAAEAVAGLTTEEYPIVAADADTPSHFEFLDRIPDDVLARREAWRGFDAEQRVSTLNETLSPFGYRLVAEKNAEWHRTFYDLYRGEELLLSNLSHIWPVAVNESGTDFAFMAENAPNQGPTYLLIRNGDVQPLEPNQFAYIPPVYLGDDLVTVERLGGWRFAVKRGDEVVYTYASEPRADLPVKQLVAWEGHWILETVEGVFTDGESLIEQLGVDEIFHYVIFRGRPLFFFERGGRVDISYGGETLPYTYDEVIHYRCCEPAVFNLASNEHMLWFYALKDGTWYYVEMGVYDE